MTESYFIIKDGFLTKQGGFFKSWHRRWFSLMGKDLYYAKTKGDKEKGRIDLESATQVALAPESKKANTFKIVIPNVRTYLIQADTEKECKEWVEIIQKVMSGENLQATLSLEDLVTIQDIHLTSRHKILIVSKKNEHGTNYVLKTYPKSCLVETTIESSIKQRATFLKATPKFVVPLRYIINESDQVCLVSDVIKFGCLFGRLEAESKFSESRSMIYAAQILAGLNEFHRLGIIYRDLKPSNVLLDEKGFIRLTDPGFYTQTVDERLTEYTAPELYAAEPEAGMYTDWYGLGVLLYEMICGLPPFWDEDRSQIRSTVLNTPLRFPHHVSETARACVRRLMERTPERRLGFGGVEEIMNDPFFAPVAWDELLEKKMRPEVVPQPGDTVHTTYFG